MPTLNVCPNCRTTCPGVIPKLIQVILFGFVMIAKENTMENVAFVMENLEEAEVLELVGSVILAIK